MGKNSRIVIGLFFSAVFSVIILYFISFILPPPTLTAERNTLFYDSEGEYLGEERGLESRYWIPLESIPPSIVNATVLTEDQHFYKHYGFDFPRIISAFLTNIKHRSLKEGASTITQQYARNLFLTHEKTWKRKIKEAFYTVRIEMHYSKEEILEGYLNTVYFGHGAYGIEAASRYFFNKEVSQLTLAEGVMLIGIPKGPSYYSPFVNEERAKNRQRHILHLLKKAGKVSDTKYRQAINEEIRYLTKHEHNSKSFSPYFQDEALKEAAAILKKEVSEVKTGGYHIYTTLNKKEQRSLETIIRHELANNDELQVGAIAMEANSGAIRALIGGRDYEKSPFNRASQAKRMAGSTFKPFLYYAALEKNFSPTTKLKSERTSFSVDGVSYEPRNFNNYYADKPITLAQALALSDNVYAVKTHLFLGMEELIKTGELLGFNDLQVLPSLALGAVDVTVKQMADAYSTIASGGKRIEGYTVERIENTKGQIVYERKEKPKQILNEQSAFILTDMLTGMFDPELNGYTQVTGSTIASQLTHSYAGKSGSTDYDSWMIGFSPSLTTALWLGYDKNKKLTSPLDYNYAKRIWGQFMEESHKGKLAEEFPVPSGVVQVNIDPESGLVATEHCPQSRKMYFKAGTEPRVACNLHANKEEIKKQSPKEKQERHGLLKRIFDFLFQ